MTSSTESGVRKGLIALIVLLVAVLALLLVNLLPLVVDLPRAPESDSVRQEVTSSVSLDEGYIRARERALAWATDAVLVRVESSWYATAGWEDMEIPPLAWGFLFYSPSESSLVTVVVDDTELLWVPPAVIPIVPTPIEVFPPTYAPDLVWVTFLAAGGETFLREHPQGQVTYRLMPADTGLIWKVSAFQDDAHLEISVDAESGIVMTPSADG